MPRFDKRLITSLDAAAELTGIPGLATRKLRRRRFRWLPITALALGFGGFAFALAAPDQFYVGLGAVLAGEMIACWLPMLGPLKVVGGAEIADEFDRAIYLRSHMVAFACIAFTAFVALFLIAGLALILNWRRETLIVDLITLGLLLPLMWSAIPTLHASWTVRPLDEED